MQLVFQVGDFFFHRLSQSAKKVYRDMAEEEINLFNSMIEKRMKYAEGATIEEYSETSVMSKMSRSSIKYVQHPVFYLLQAQSSMRLWLGMIKSCCTR